MGADGGWIGTPSNCQFIDRHCALARLGVAVTIVIRRDKVLRGFDEEIRDQLMAALAQAGIKVVNFGPQWSKTAVDLSWEDLTKLSPDSIGKLRAIIDKAGK